MSAMRRRGGRRIRRLALLAAVAAAVAAAGGALWWLRAPSPGEPPRVDLAGTDATVAAAIAAARERLVREPTAASAWGSYGQDLLAHDYFQAAAVCFETAARLAPAEPRWPYLQAIAFLKGNPDTAAALPCLERAARLERSSPVPRLVLAETLFQEGRLDAAAAEFRAVLASRGSDPRAELGLGRIAHARDDLESARRHLETALAAAPGVKAAATLLAEVLFRAGERAGAERQLEIATALSETYTWPDPYYQEVLARRGTALAAIERASGLFASGRGEDALDLLRATLRRDPDAFLVRLFLGRLLLQSDRGGEAEAVLRTAVAASPQSLEAWFELGSALERQAKTEEAIAAFRRAAELKADFAPAHHRLGLCLARKGDRAAALAALRAAVHYRPDYAVGYRDLGHFLIEVGRAGEAREPLERALGLNPADARARELLGRLGR